MAVFSRISRPRNVALAAVLAANGVLAQNNCFTLQGITDDGNQVNFLQVSDGGTGTFTAGFTDDEGQATVLGIDPTTGTMLDYSNEGRITNIDAGFDFDYLFFDFQQTMDEFDQLAVNCATDTDGILTCTAADNAAVNVFNYCDGVVGLGDRIRDDFGCQGLTLVASDAGACPAIPEPPVTTSTTSSISTSTSVSTSVSVSTEVSTTTAETTTTSVSTTTSASTVDPNETSTTTTTSSVSSASTDAGVPTDSTTTITSTTSGASTTAGQSTDAPVMTTSTVFATETLTVTESGAVTTTVTTYPLYTTVCPVGGGAYPTAGYPAAPGGGYVAPGGGSYAGGNAPGAPGYGAGGAPGAPGYGAGGAPGAPGYGAGGAPGAPGYGAGGAPGAGYVGAAPSAPVYNPGHLAALPPTVCASQLNSVATNYPAGAMNHYESYGVTPVAPGTPGYGTGSGNAPSGGNNGGYGSGSGNGAAPGGNNGGYTGGQGGAGNAPAGGNNAYGAGNGGYGAGAGAGGDKPAGNNGGYDNAAAPNNGSAPGGYPHGGAASGTESWKANPTAPMQYEGSASTVKMALGGVFAAAIALVCLI